ncbi:MAG: branched-chain amino acid transport system ATP-binding protein livF [Actinomycetota bacterium]|jgi:branched-chain amino acid transport system ATP-binding protein|nr:branched-chain amino acid transport system ATP-binding protein livF [Actinomycetota bacterium]
MRQLDVRGRVGRLTGGASVTPLALLATLYFFDEFDTSAFGVLAPNIKNAFHMSDGRYTTVVLLNLSIVLLLGIPAGYLGDRGPRRLLVVVCGIGAGIFSLLTGVVGSVFLLLLVRIGNGIGNLSNTTVQQSLLADYYTPEARSGIFSLYLATPSIGAIVGGVTAGSLASMFGWRAPFFLFIIPIVLTSLLCLRLLRDPLRGEADDAASAAEVVGERAPSLPEAARTLWAVRTLRRQYITYAFYGAGLLPLAIAIPLFYERIYHLGDFGRGALVSIDNAAALLGTLFIGPRTRRWLSRDVGLPLRWVGGFSMLVGVLVVVMAQAPWEWLSMAASVSTFFVAGMFVPPFITVQSLVAPARVRTTAFAYGYIFLVGGVILLYLIIPVATIADRHGMRAGLAALGPYWIVAGILVWTTARFVADDAASALRSLAALARLRKRQAETGTSALLTCAGIDVGYDAVQVLFGVDFEVEEGEIVALLGTNGAGKSTLLKAISGLQPPSAGTIVFEGNDITYADPKVRFKAGIVQMPGGRSVFPTLTVDECLRLSTWTSRQSAEEAKAAADRVLEQFPVLRERKTALAGNLSGGEQQMLGLGMVLIAKPRLLMIDELSLGLAPTIVAQLVDIVRAIHAQGTTVVIVEQSVNVALTLAERAVFMEKGEVRFSGPTADLLDRDDILRAVFLEGAAKATGAKTTARPKAARADRREEVLAAPAVLELAGVTVDYGGVRAVDGVSLSLHEDEVVGLIGPNGAGKTTLLDAVSGFAPSTGGFVVLEGQDVTGWSPDRRARHGLGRSFQDARIFPSLTVVENLALALERHLDVRDPFACALGLPAVLDSEAKAALTVHELVELLGLGAFRNKFVGELSTGTRRMVDLGMSVAHRPRVLLLDEPSSGIAQRETEALGPVLKSIQNEVGCALLVIEHDMPLITELADTLIALETGTVIAEGTPREVVNDQRVVASYLGDNEAAILRSGKRK